jgi:hypothetical protein
MSDVNIGTVKAKLEFDSSDASKGIADVSKALGSFSEEAAGLAAALGPVAGALTAVGAAAAAAISTFLEWSDAALASADRLTNLSAKTRASVEALQMWSREGKTVGVTAEQISTSVVRMQRALEKTPQSFQAIGLSISYLKSLSPDQQFNAVAESLRRIQDPAEQAALSMKLLGDRSGEMLKFIREAPLDLQDFGEMTTAQAHNLDTLGDSLGEVKAATADFTTQVAALVLEVPGVTESIRDLASIIGAMARAVRDNSANLREATVIVTNFGISVSGAFSNVVQSTAFLKAMLSVVADFVEQMPKVNTQFGQAPEFVNEFGQSIEDLTKIAIKSGDDQDAAAKKAERAWKEAQRSIHEANRQALEDEKALRSFLSESQRGGPSFTSGSATGDIFSSGLTLPPGLSGAALDENNATFNKIFAEQLNKFNANRTVVEQTVKSTVDWSKALEDVAHQLQAIGGVGGLLGQIATAVGGIAGGIAGIGANLKNFKLADKAGGLEGFLGKVSAGLGIASAAIGIGSAIVGLFKSDPVKKAQQEAGKALGYGISREMAQQFMDEAKRLGVSVSQVAKDYQRRIEAEQKKTNMEILAAGVGVAEGGAQTLLDLMDKLSPEAQAAGGALVKAVQDAMIANGLGYWATGKLAQNEQFKAAQGAVGAASQVIGGMRQAGGIDQALLANTGALAGALKTQATEATIAAGMTAEEAQRVGIATIAPLLKQQLDASMASGKELDANTKALLDEAKANGIDIVADPLLQQLDVQKQQLAELQKISGGGGIGGGGIGGGGVGGYGERGQREGYASGGVDYFGAGTQTTLHGNEAVVPLDRPTDRDRVLGEIGIRTGGQGGGMVVNQTVVPKFVWDPTMTKETVDRYNQMAIKQLIKELRGRNSTLGIELSRTMERQGYRRG